VTARIYGGALNLVVDANGPRAAVKEEIAAGLAGAPFQAGLGGRWIQGAWVAALATAAGGSVSVAPHDGGVKFVVSLPQGA
jgi:hypothetical protein